MFNRITFVLKHLCVKQNEAKLTVDICIMSIFPFFWLNIQNIQTSKISYHFILSICGGPCNLSIFKSCFGTLLPSENSFFYSLIGNRHLHMLIVSPRRLSINVITLILPSIGVQEKNSNNTGWQRGWNQLSSSGFICLFVHVSRWVTLWSSPGTGLIKTMLTKKPPPTLHHSNSGGRSYKPCTFLDVFFCQHNNVHYYLCTFSTSEKLDSLKKRDWKVWKVLL